MQSKPLAKILAASRVDATIDLAAIPVAAAVRALFSDRWLELATRGGEDYELLLTIPADRVSHLQEELAGIGITDRLHQARGMVAACEHRLELESETSCSLCQVLARPG